MSTRSILRLLAGYAFVLGLACFGIIHEFTLRDDPHGEVIASLWQDGDLVERLVFIDAATQAAWLGAARPSHRQIVLETVIAQGPLLARPEAAFSLSLVAPLDGVKATLAGATAYVTPDDLLLRQAYDRGIQDATLGVSAGVDVQTVLLLLSQRLHTSVREVLEFADLRRIRVRRTALGVPPSPSVDAQTLSRDQVREAVVEASSYLTRGVDEAGRFRYFVDASTNRNLPGYDWPRHAGATYFLAQAAALSGDADVRAAAIRAASRLRDNALVTCGDEACIADDSVAEIGSSALAIIAFVEIARTGIDPTFAPTVASLARFLRTQQRPDGEFMHQYDRDARRPIDVQFLYFSGEATLALSRAHALTQDPDTLVGAKSGLANLVGPAWHFFGDRYYFGEEHWTCQAMADLWTLAPNGEALDFCMRWQAYGRKMQHVAGDSPRDAEGSFGVDPIITPRFTPVASRCEAGVATLEIARRTGQSAPEIAALDLQLRRSLALLVRKQFRPGPVHLFASKEAVRGAFPGSDADWQLRIDYAQHAGSAMIRWLEVTRP